MKYPLILGFSILFVLSCGPSARHSAEEIQKESAKIALNEVPIPVVKNFQERKTIAKWTSR